jgi:hypothetical protein
VGPLKHTQARLDSRAGTKFKLVADERAVCVTGYSAFSRACSPVIVNVRLISMLLALGRLLVSEATSPSGTRSGRREH